MRAAFGPAALLATFAVTWPCHAQRAADADVQNVDAEHEHGEEQGADAELVQELLQGDAQADDLAWLYSSADEYTPADIAGTPIPAPELPGPGGGTPRTWNPRWRKFGTGNYVLTGVGFGLGALSSAIPPRPSRWQVSNAVDEWGREHLGFDDYDQGRWAQDTSDVLLSLNVAFPLIVDALILAHWYRQSPIVGTQIALITLEAMAVATVAQGPTAGLASRERPYGRDCGKTIPSDLDDCAERKRYRSYFSGHTSAAFSAAGATCSHHLQHELFGSKTADAVTCGVALTSAATVGLMRIVGRQHYITDVVTGAFVGALSGLGVPWLLHYAEFDNEEPAITLTLVPNAQGLSVGGAF
jgi:membrane-associated phospholipid phosphatase